MSKCSSDFSFLKSNRFQALVIIAVVMYFGSNGYVPEDVVLLVQTVLGGHIAIKSLDRASEKIGG